MEKLKNKTLFILDWDDTLFPTKWTFKNGINLLIPSKRDQCIVYYQELDKVLSIFLQTLTKHGRVIIVTNAAKDWVSISSVVLPQTSELLKRIKIVSAKETYRTKSSNSMDWKTMAFRDIINYEFKNSLLMNVISIGDAEYEYQALIALNKLNHPVKYLKSIRFMENPSHDVLIDQLQVLNNVIPDIWEKSNHMDLKFDNFSKVNKKNKIKRD